MGAGTGSLSTSPWLGGMRSERRKRMRRSREAGSARGVEDKLTLTEGQRGTLAAMGKEGAAGAQHLGGSGEAKGGGREEEARARKGSEARLVARGRRKGRRERTRKEF